MEPRARFERLPAEASSKLQVEEVFSAYHTSTAGLSVDEAHARFARFGANELSAKRVTGWSVFKRQLTSPLIYMLGAAALVSLLLGEWLDGLTIAAMLCVNTGIGFFQEYRSERALEKLREHLAPRARVRRGGEVMSVDRRRLVPGDLVLLKPGDIVPADLRLTLSHRLTLDEAALTGEARAREKTVEAEQGAKNGRAGNMAYLLTRVAAGYGEGVVASVAAESVIGRIAKLTEETVRISAFERNIQDFSRFLMKAVLAVLAVVFVINVLLKGESQIVPLFLFAVALAVGVVPEALPAITTLTLASGAIQLAKRHVVVKRLSAIEDLGHMEILCTDKTGTMTEGIMTVDEVASPIPARCLQWALAVVSENEHLASTSAPKTFDAAMAAKIGTEGLKKASELKRVWFAPFDPMRRRSTAVFAGHERLLAVVGAPEEILKRATKRMLPHGDEALTPQMRKIEEEAVRQDGLHGRRVLAIAVKRIDARTSYDESDEADLSYVGRIAFVDPLKRTAKATLEEARKLNVRIKILTGDSAEVAGAIGLELGVLKSAGDVVTGEQLEAASHEELHALAKERDVFARVSPEQKYRLIEALQHDAQVGFLGEGINDAPALKVANVGLAVDGASDVAREAADIILLKKDLRVVIDGVRQGRAIFTNIVKYVKNTLIGNLGNFMSIAGISLLINDLPMLPVQILLANLLADVPLISISSDAVDEDEVVRPKRFNLRELAFIGVFLGLVSSFFDFAFFALSRRDPLAATRTLWFLFSVLTELALIYSIRTRGPFWKAARPGKALIGLTIATVAVCVGVTYVPFGHAVFQFSSPLASGLARIAALTAAYFATTELVKLVYAKMFSPFQKPA